MYYTKILGLNGVNGITLENLKIARSLASNKNVNKNVIKLLTVGLYDPMKYDDNYFLRKGKNMYIKYKMIDKKSSKIKRPRMDIECLEIWPVRNKADLRIRRFRLFDLIIALSNREYDIISDLRLDYVTMSNLIIYMIVFGYDWFKRLKDTGIMDSWDAFSSISRTLSTLAKKKDTINIEVKQHFAELSSLLGYQQLPFLGDGIVTKEYNLFDDMEELANGGNEHGLRTDDWISKFRSAYKEISSVSSYENINFMTLEEYVKKGIWLTAGSSSIGKVEWSWNEDKGHFKARKNMLFDLYTPEELWVLIEKWNGKVINKAVNKFELGKVRLAVSSSLELYICESYLMKMTGHLYKKWDGITLDESVSEDINRVLQIQGHFKEGCHALPFDYASFDNQVTTKEVQIIVKEYFALGRKNIPPNYFVSYDNLINKVVNAYDNSVLIGKNGSKEKEVKIKGGLPSGIRVTSLVGNIWNSIMTRNSKNIVEKVLGYQPVKHSSLRGDDSKIICNTALECYFIRLGYQSINAIGNNNKFAIMAGEGEFLRCVTDKDKRYGWVNRAIPSLTQRKPQNSEPWSPNHEIKTLKDNIDLLERRSQKDLSILHYSAKRQWSQRVKQSTHWLDLPIRLGGLGLYKYKGWVTDSKLSLRQKPKILVEDLTEQKDLSWISLTKEEKKEYHLIRFNEKMISDDIPGISKYYHKQLQKTYDRLKPVWVLTQVYPTKLKVVKTWPETQAGREITHKKQQDKRFVSSDPNFPQLEEFLREYNVVTRVSKSVDSLAKYLEKYYIDFYCLMKGWELKGWHRTDAIELAFGKMPIEPANKINPTLTEFIKTSVKKSGILYLKGRKNIAINLHLITRLACDYLYNSSISKIFRF